MTTVQTKRKYDRIVQRVRIACKNVEKLNYKQNPLISLTVKAV